MGDNNNIKHIVIITVMLILTLSLPINSFASSLVVGKPVMGTVFVIPDWLKNLPIFNLPTRPILSNLPKFEPLEPLSAMFNNMIKDFLTSNTVEAAQQVKSSIDSVFFITPSFFYDRPAIILAWKVCRAAAGSMVMLIILFWAVRYMLRAAFPDVPRAMQFLPRVVIGSFLIYKSDWIVSTTFYIFRVVFLTISSFFKNLSILEVFEAISIDIPLINILIYIVAIVMGVIFIFQCLVRIIAATVVFVTSPFAFLAWINTTSKPLYDGWVKFGSTVVLSWILNIIVLIIIASLNLGSDAFFGSGFLNSLLACAGLYFLTKTNKYCQEFVGAWGTYTNLRQGATNLVSMAKYIPIK